MPWTVKVEPGSLPGWLGVPLMIAPTGPKVAGKDSPAGSAPATMLSVPPALWLVDRWPW